MQSTLGPMDILDEEEQNKIIADLRIQADQQSKWARRVLSMLIAVVCAVFAWRLYIVVTDPLRGLAFQTNVVRPLEGSELAFSYACQCVALLCAIAVLSGQTGTGTGLILKACGGSSAVMTAWVWSRIAFDAALPRFALWVPISGIALVALAWYIDSDLSRMGKDIDDLADMRYNFKSI